MQDTASEHCQGLLENPAHRKLDRLGLCDRFLNAGAQAGFDMASHAGIAAWTAELRRQLKAAPPQRSV